MDDRQQVPISPPPRGPWTTTAEVKVNGSSSGGGNGSGNGLGGLPPWIRAVAIVGIPGAIAVFLVWMGAKEVPRISAQVVANSANIQAVKDQQAKQIDHDEEMYRMLQRICSNTAKTEDDRARCFDK